MENKIFCFVLFFFQLCHYSREYSYAGCCGLCFFIDSPVLLPLHHFCFKTFSTFTYVLSNRAWVEVREQRSESGLWELTLFYHVGPRRQAWWQVLSLTQQPGSEGHPISQARCIYCVCFRNPPQATVPAALLSTRMFTP